MFFSKAGLILDDQGNQVSYIPWKEVHRVYNWVIFEGKDYKMYPSQVFTREQIAFIISNYEDRINEQGNQNAEPHCTSGYDVGNKGAKRRRLWGLR